MAYWWLFSSLILTVLGQFWMLQECNLYQLMKKRENLFSDDEVRNLCFQVFQGLAYMHQRGYFHRDLKPGTVS